MHPELQKVVELQEADQTIASLTSQIEAIPSQIKKIEDQLNAFLHAHDERKSRLAANQKERRDLDGEIQIIRSKISKHKDQLYEVKTNEQYKTMLHEIEGEEQKIRKIEDRILEKMSEAEELEKHVQDAAARLEGERAGVARQKKQLEAERDTAETARREAEERRQALAAALGEPALRLYEKARKARGVAVVPVVDGSCTGCHVRLRPQAYNEVRSSNEIMTCESCGRILYYVHEPTGEATDPVVITAADAEKFFVALSNAMQPLPPDSLRGLYLEGSSSEGLAISFSNALEPFLGHTPGYNYPEGEPERAWIDGSTKVLQHVRGWLTGMERSTPGGRAFLATSGVRCDGQVIGCWTWEGPDPAGFARKLRKELLRRAAPARGSTQRTAT